jgi:hypothetical protein
VAVAANKNNGGVSARTLRLTNTISSRREIAENILSVNRLLIVFTKVIFSSRLTVLVKILRSTIQLDNMSQIKTQLFLKREH